MPRGTAGIPTGSRMHRKHRCPACGAVHRQPIAGRNIGAGRHLIHEPSLRPYDFFVLAVVAAIPITVWILHNASSVIILHLLSMNKIRAAPHKKLAFPPPCRRRHSDMVCCRSWRPGAWQGLARLTWETVRVSRMRVALSHEASICGRDARQGGCCPGAGSATCPERRDAGPTNHYYIFVVW